MAKSRPKYVQNVWRRDSDGRTIKVVEAVGRHPSQGAPGELHPVLSVIIPAYGRQDLVANAVASVRNNLRWNCAEVIVVDDGSPEPIAKEEVGGARLLRLPENSGFGMACDRGAIDARGAFLLFLNSDAAVEPGCIEAMLEWANRGWDVVGPRLLYPSGTVQHAGYAWDPEKRSHQPVGKREREDAPVAITPVEVDAVTGACMLVRASTFRELGGFGWAYGRGYYEDIDLCLRAWETGHRVLYAGDAVARHWESQSFGDFHRTESTRKQIDSSHRVFLDRWPLERLRLVWERRAASSFPTVDVVVTTHGACDRVAECLRATRETLQSVDLPEPGMAGPFHARVLVVDDASPGDEGGIIRTLAQHWGAEYVRIEENVGYRRAAERGITETSGEYFVLLNSDTVPTRGWLAKMLRAAVADPKVAVVNPLSNASANLSVPLWRGRDLEAQARSASAASLGAVVDVAYPVGFCLLVRRAAWDALGGFDGETFPEAYGEETDFCERALQAGWRCVLEPSAFVYHEGKASHRGRALEMERAAVGAFLEKHGDQARKRLSAFEHSGVMHAVRDAVARARCDDPRPAVVFYLPELNLCGGVLACYHLARRLSSAHGWRAVVATKNLLQHDFMQHAGRLYPLHYTSAEQFVAAFPNDGDAPRHGVLVATAWFSARSVAAAAERTGGRFVPAYFVQDDEAMFEVTDGKGRGYGGPDEVHATYAMVPNIVANSPWVADVVRANGADATMIPVGVDTWLFRPRPKYDRFTVLAMCRHTTPRRGYDLLAEVYRELRDRWPDARLLVYGQVPLPRHAAYMEPLGHLAQHELAEVMGRAHVLVEPSIFQGFGLPALEAMSSGCVPVSLDNRGIHAYGVHERDCLVVRPEGVVDAVARLRADDELRVALAKRGRETALEFSWDSAAAKWDGWLRALRGFPRELPAR